MSISIKVLKGGAGDSILVKLNCKNILIDGGATMQYPNHLKVELEEILKKKESLDLVIGTHFDEDHINGLYRLLEDIESKIFPTNFIKDFWFQIPPRITIESRHPDDMKIGVAKAKKLESLLKNHNWKNEDVIFSNVPLELNSHSKLWILSPDRKSLKEFKDNYQEEWELTKLTSIESEYKTDLIDFDNEWGNEDSSKSNGSSIAVLIEYRGDKKILLLADSKPSVIVKSLKKLGYRSDNKLNVEYMKLSHHGSKKSLSKELLDLIQCSNYIISTSGSKHNLPNKKTFAHILKHYSTRDVKAPIFFIFNYDKADYQKIFSKKDFEDFSFNCTYTNFPHGYQIDIQ